MSVASVASPTYDPGPVPALDRRPLVYTYTILNTYASVCPEQMQRRYITRDIPYVETLQMKWGNTVHTAMERRVGRGVKLPDDMAKWEIFAHPLVTRKAMAERKLGVTREGRKTGYWDADCWFRGKVDTTIIQDVSAFINDWKSGSSKYEDPFELETNAILVKANFPQITRIAGTYTWLAENRVSSVYDLSDFTSTWTKMHKLAALIERDRAAGVWEKRRSGLCSWCDVKDCENWRPRT